MANPGFLITYVEMQACDGIPTEVWRLYCYLRSRMDFDTGLVGTGDRWISRDMMRDHLIITPKTRSTKAAYRPSPTQLKGFIKALKDVGLIEVLEKKKNSDPAVFRLLMANIGKTKKDLPKPGKPELKQPVAPDSDEQPDEQPSFPGMSNQAKPNDTNGLSGMSNQAFDVCVTGSVTNIEPEILPEIETTDAAAPITPKFSASGILKMYHRILPNFRKVRKLTDARRKTINARNEDYPDLDWENGFFNLIAKSSFLMASADKKVNWLDFEWLVNPNNMVKILEGKYEHEDGRSGSGNDPQAGQKLILKARRERIARETEQANAHRHGYGQALVDNG